MIQDNLNDYALQHGISLEDAMQVFFQVIVLKHISVPEARFMGGTALVFGHGNPRFSEDVDLTQVASPQKLKIGLEKAAQELSHWLGLNVTVTPPKLETRTWRLQCAFDRAHTLRLHVDSQPFRAYTDFPIVVQFPALPPFVCASLQLDEIMADKIVAVGNRSYLGGRDLFDLWFHWLKNADWQKSLPRIQDLVQKKIRERDLSKESFLKKLDRVQEPQVYLKRIREEWRRYLPVSMHSPLIEKEILKQVSILSKKIR